MKLHTVKTFGNIPPGAQVYLTRQQASARAHLVTQVKDFSGKGKDARGLFEAYESLGFKAGEILGVHGSLDRGMELMFGIEPEAPSGAGAKPERKAAEIARLQADLDDAEGKLGAAEAAVAAAQSSDDRTSLEAAVVSATAVRDAARVALDEAQK